MSQKDVFIVIGGSGFLGREVVQQLLARGDTVSALDIVQRHHDVPFYSADITNQEQVEAAFKQSGATCIIHTASPPTSMRDTSIYWKVNVEGTKTIIAAAVATGVPKLVFTSSAAVVYSGADLVDVDERQPYAAVPLDEYTASKTEAEKLVLAANGTGGLLTVALRPAGIYGPGDRQLTPGLYNVWKTGKSHVQVGNNDNLFDYTYVGNVAYAHLLAADRLSTPPPGLPLSALEKLPESIEELPPRTPAEEEILYKTLPPLGFGASPRRIPTCEARPLGPYVTPPPNAEEIAAAFADPTFSSERPQIRTRYDAFSDHALDLAKLQNPDINPLQVAGQAFFITNGEPICFWTFARTLWQNFDQFWPGYRKPKRRFVLNRPIAMFLGAANEWICWLVGVEPLLTRFRMSFSCSFRYYNIEKARRLLGYEPQVSHEEGLRRTSEWWFQEVNSGNAEKVKH